MLAGATAVVVALTLTGCTQQPAAEAPVASSSAALTATGAVPTAPDDLATNSAHHTLEVAGEPFGLTVDYWTSYAAANWQTLQPKDINLSLHLAPSAAAGDQPEVLVGSFDAVTTLLAAMPGLDGLPIAATNEQPAAIAGFLISTNYPYDALVPIEGFSPPLVARWQLLAGDQALTEQALSTAGVYGNRITFSFRMLVRNNGDSGYHQRTVQDVLTLPETTGPAAQGTAAGTVTAPTTG